jgi:hypothetical protein
MYPQKIIVSSSLISWFLILSRDRICDEVAPEVKFMVNRGRWVNERGVAGTADNDCLRPATCLDAKPIPSLNKFVSSFATYQTKNSCINRRLQLVQTLNDVLDLLKASCISSRKRTSSYSL